MREMATKAELREKLDAQDAAIELLRSMLPVGSTATALVRHVSRSGMRRSISVLVVEDGVIHDMSWSVARALGWRLDRDRGGVVVGGTGMDMAFHLIYTLSQVLYAGDGYALNHRRV